MLYLQAAKESGVQPAVGAEASFREKFIKTLPRRPKGKELEKAMGPVAYARLERKLAEDALIDAYRAHYWTNSYLTVSEEAISNKWEEVLRVNEKADKMNAKMRAKALEFRQKVLDGADFGELTLKYAKVHPEYGTNWKGITISMSMISGSFESAENSISSLRLSGSLRVALGTAMIRHISQRTI